MTPKSLLRHKRVISDLDEIGPGTTLPSLAVGRCANAPARRSNCEPDDEIRRVVLCSGKVYYDLLEAREPQGSDDVYLLRVEQLYPFPARALMQELGRFKFAEIVWCQEEPKNMGAWYFVDPNIEWVL